MGVAGDFLPRVLESRGRRIDLSNYKDGIHSCLRSSSTHRRPNEHRKRPLRIGIDASSWIYRAGFAMGHLLMKDDRHLTNYGRAQLHIPTTTTTTIHNSSSSANSVENYCKACVNYVLKRLELLKEGSNADLLLVLDGRTPPLKAAVVDQRRKHRAQHEQVRSERTFPPTTTTTTTTTVEERTQANRRAGPGDHYSAIVDALFQEIVSRQDLAAWMVAPYEADAQLAYLSKQSYIDLVITEDSDLLAHGCRSILYKTLETEQEQQHQKQDSNVNLSVTRGILLEFKELGGIKLASTTPSSSSSSLDFTDFTPLMMAVLFVLLGCDYNGYQKLKGIGVATACKIVRKAFLEASVPGLETLWKEAYEHSHCKRSVLTKAFCKNYQRSFVEALWSYLHPLVLDPIRQEYGSFSDHPPLLLGCTEYEELLSDPARVQGLVGHLPSPNMAPRTTTTTTTPTTQWKEPSPKPKAASPQRRSKRIAGRSPQGSSSSPKIIRRSERLVQKQQKEAVNEEGSPSSPPSEEKLSQEWFATQDFKE